jgi:RNA polymerase sigma-70 factor (family 1)
LLLLLYPKLIAMLDTPLYYKQFSDEELFRLAKVDDQIAFGEIYARYWPVLTGTACHHLQSRAKAEDIVQEIFISFYKRRELIELSISLKAYLTQALKFKMMNEHRSQVVRDAYQKTITHTTTHSDSHNAYETKELTYYINRSIKQLPDKCRQAFILSRAEDLSYKDISGQLGISVSTVEKHISKALRMLKTSLNMCA